MGRKRRTYMIRSIILYFLTDIFYILWKNLGFVQLNNEPHIKLLKVILFDNKKLSG